jgi:hypothetical protein
MDLLRKHDQQQEHEHVVGNQGIGGESHLPKARPPVGTCQAGRWSTEEVHPDKTKTAAPCWNRRLL